MSNTVSPDEILSVLMEVAGTDEVLKNQQLELYEAQVLDSMRTVELILALDIRFGVSVSPAEFDRAAWATPALFVTDVQQRMAAA